MFKNSDCVDQETKLLGGKRPSCLAEMRLTWHSHTAVFECWGGTETHFRTEMGLTLGRK